MKTEIKTGPGQQQPSPATPQALGADTGEAVTTSSGIRFSLPSLVATQDAAVSSPDSDLASRADQQYF